MIALRGCIGRKEPRRFGTIRVFGMLPQYVLHFLGSRGGETYADCDVIARYAFGAWCCEDGDSCEFYWGEAIFGSGFYVEEGGFGDSYLNELDE
jgi:hypothetical protein